MEHYPANARAKATDMSINALRGAVQEFAADCGAPPSTERGLQALMLDPGIPGWAGPYLRGESQEIFLDLWSTPFHYESDGSTFSIRSAGKDGTFGTDDDQVGSRRYSISSLQVVALVLLVLAATVATLIRSRSKHKK